MVAAAAAIFPCACLAVLFVEQSEDSRWRAAEVGGQETAPLPWPVACVLCLRCAAETFSLRQSSQGLELLAFSQYLMFARVVQYVCVVLSLHASNMRLV